MNTDLEIKKADVSHADSIKRIWNPIIRDTLWTFNSLEKSIKNIEDLIIERDRMDFGSIVALRSNKVVGFATYSQFRPGTGYLKTMEHTVIVDPENRGQGVGKNLVKTLAHHAADRGIISLIAGVSEENAAGIAFHEHLGFQRISVLPQVGFKFGRSLDLVLMQKKLAS